ncbi:MAG: glycoside hydrolase family 3 protein [Rhodoglobus sp.]|nr:glycoside hydrolase family 3 protein [Rhodoglobus sp.]
MVHPALPRRFLGAAAAAVLLLGGCTAAAPEPAPTAAQRPEPPVVDPVQQYADDRVSVMTLDQKIASMLMVHVPGLDAAQLGGFAAAYGLGGLILMGDNIPDPPGALAGMTPMMSAQAGLPVLIATDQEGGVVRRIYTDDAASAEQLRYAAPDAARAAFAERGALLESVGITVNFGVVADVSADPASFIFERSMGSTAADAAARVSEAVAGESGEVLSTLKHFPGHGVSGEDSHTGIPSTGMGLDEWRAGHAPPFEAGIDAGAELVMFGHLQFDAVDPVPATLSSLWHEVLRDDLGFDGITITDDMNMLERSGRPEYASQAQNAVLAVLAGNTMLLYVGAVDVPAVVTAVREAVLAGTIPVALVDDAARKLLVLRRTLSGETGRFVHCFEECQQIIE